MTVSKETNEHNRKNINNDVNNKTCNIDNISEHSSEDYKVKFNPYNINNKLITKKNVIDILLDKDIHIDVINLRNYQLAFAHKSYCKKNDPDNKADMVDKPDNALELMEKSNERLEYLGDSILSCVVADYLYERYPEQDEGFLTKIRTRLVNGAMLNIFSQVLKLSDFLMISRHVEDKCNGRNNPRILEDIFEAFIGAIYLDNTRPFYEDGKNKCEHEENNIHVDNPIKKLNNNSINELELIKKKSRSPEIKNMIDNVIANLQKSNESNELIEKHIKNERNKKGFEICKTFIINTIEDIVSFTDIIRIDNNYKDQLLRFFQQKFQEVPKYIEISCDGPPHDRKFTMGVMNAKQKIIGQSTEKTKKKAEQMASKQALLYMKVILPS
jgi:dsRNA-specific ribonuclease